MSAAPFACAAQRYGVHVVAIHGHNLGDGLAGFLPRRGILCSAHLDRHLFQGLAGDGRAA